MTDKIDLLERRKKAFGPHAPLFYDQPIHMVRGEGCWMWDSDGERYLDCYNNVPHVGHCHPRVTTALYEQAQLLNVHTRYLNERVLDYTERLTGSFPDPLDRAMLCCTGTEANELALRIARSLSGNQGVIVSDFSYHGNSAALAVLTTGLPHPEPFADFARAVAVPDPYLWEGSEEEMVAHHLSLVDTAIASLQQQGHGVAAVLFDSAFSTEGLVAVPPAYVQGVAERIRQAGGFYIADEVQAGFGRMGDAMWGFASAGITPNLVTLGKPMGNGHPIAGVVTSTDIANRFTRDALYFNTFAGNPVSAAVGSAVLDIIADEGLVTRAALTGTYLQQRLSALADTTSLIGDVRGKGLFAALEITNPQKRADPIAARAIVNGMRNRNVLISRTGPRDNVLKIRPPMQFGQPEVDVMLAALTETIEAISEAPAA